MTDIVDLAAEIEAEHLAVSLLSIDRSIPDGVRGVCDECEEEMPRLVGGRCGFCRDGRTPPASFYLNRETRLPIPSPAEEHVPMVAKQPVITNRKITIEGEALAAVERRADADDISFKQAATELIELALAQSNQAAPSQPSSAGTLSICTLDELLDELRDRFNAAGPRVADAEAALATMTARAEQAEARLDAIRAQVFGA